MGMLVSRRNRGFVPGAAMLVCTLASLACAALARDDGGWRPLFDGTSMDGWKHVGPGRFVLQDGVLKTEGGLGLLYYEREKFGNCDLRVVYRLTQPHDNSGVYVKIDKKPDDPWYGVHHGYEVQIYGGPGVDPYRVTGAVYTFAKATAYPSHAPGEWNTMLVQLRGRQVTVFINRVQVSHLDADHDPVPPRLTPGGLPDPEAGPRAVSGYIGLQNHDNNVTVFFKAVSVRPLHPPAAGELVRHRFD
jgi:hypothetical protein